MIEGVGVSCSASLNLPGLAAMNAMKAISGLKDILIIVLGVLYFIWMRQEITGALRVILDLLFMMAIVLTIAVALYKGQARKK